RSWYLRGEFGDPNDPRSAQTYQQWVDFVNRTGGHPSQYLNLPPAVMTPQMAGTLHTQAQTRNLLTNQELERQALEACKQQGGYPGGIPPTGWTMRAGPFTITGGTTSVPYNPVPPPPAHGGLYGGGGREEAPPVRTIEPRQRQEPMPSGLTGTPADWQ